MEAFAELLKPGIFPNGIHVLVCRDTTICLSADWRGKSLRGFGKDMDEAVKALIEDRKQYEN